MVITSDRLAAGRVYSRSELADLFAIHDRGLYHGVFRPPGTRSVWLFVTAVQEAGSRTFVNRLEGDRLEMEGQRGGRSDELIADHKRLGLELLVFHRNSKDSYRGGFRFEGVFDYVSHEPGRPSYFILHRRSGDGDGNPAQASPAR